MEVPGCKWCWCGQLDEHFGARLEEWDNNVIMVNCDWVVLIKGVIKRYCATITELIGVDEGGCKLVAKPHLMACIDDQDVCLTYFLIHVR